MLQNTFLYRLWRKNKLLFLTVLAYPFIVFISCLTGLKASPFFVWAMFSTPTKENLIMSFHEVEINGKPLLKPHTWDDYNRLVLFNSINYYETLNDSNYHIPDYRTISKIISISGGNPSKILQQINPTRTEIARFPYWLKEYCSIKLHQQIDSIKVWSIQYKLINGVPNNITKTLLLAK